MLAVDYHEKIGELVARAVLRGQHVGITPSDNKVSVVIVAGLGSKWQTEADILWPTEIGALEATVEALMRALGEM